MIAVSVNGEDRIVQGREVTYNGVVALAGLDPARAWSIKFTDADQIPSDGILIPGKRAVSVRAGTKFTVANTGAA